jgi:hypothetical protein
MRVRLFFLELVTMYLLRAVRLASLCLLMFIGSSRLEAANPASPLGINLAGVADWSTEIVFVDLFKMSRPWISQAEGKPFGQGGKLDLDENGWIKSLEPGQFAETLLCVDIGSHYPGGNYVCLYEGSGEIKFLHAAQATNTRPGRVQLKIDNQRGMFALQITKTDPKNPIRNIRIIMAEHEKTSAKAPFLPSFLKRYQGFNAIRFMDWQRTNNTKVSKWSERTKPNDATQTTNKGVAVEYMIQLSNTLGIDPWFCMPHLADDDYVAQFAKLVKEKLNPNRKIYLEYSNETWNSIFEQAKYCKEQGLKLGLSNNDYEAQLRFSSQRSVEVFKIFEKVFGGKTRIVRVISTHSENPWTGTVAMDWKEAYKNADAIAIAPYFGHALGDPKTVDKVTAMSVDEVIAFCKERLESTKAKNTEYAENAKKRKLQLFAYESGQHIVGVNGTENNDKLTQLFHEVNRSPQMKDLYLQDFKNWQEIGGGLNCVFSSMSRYTKWGSWGLLEYSDQDEKTAPKYQAVREWMGLSATLKKR